MDDKLKTLLVVLLYSEFSEETWAAGWYSGAASCVPEFKDWLRRRLPAGLEDCQDEDMPALMEAFSQVVEEIDTE